MTVNTFTAILLPKRKVGCRTMPHCAQAFVWQPMLNVINAGSLPTLERIHRIVITRRRWMAA